MNAWKCNRQSNKKGKQDMHKVTKDEREHDAMQCNAIKEKDKIGQTFID